ncbi:MAG: hypothetical protein L6R36_002978 [Xanthoria steineri]|nr:MAG: hypothetical protein L6R36_002978 [Xanthoria steineri]
MNGTAISFDIMTIDQYRSESRFKFLAQTQFRQLQIAGIKTASIKVGQSQSTQPSPSPQLRSVVRNQRQWPGKPPSSQLPQNYKQTARR